MHSNLHHALLLLLYTSGYAWCLLAVIVILNWKGWDQGVGRAKQLLVAMLRTVACCYYYSPREEKHYQQGY